VVCVAYTGGCRSASGQFVPLGKKRAPGQAEGLLDKVTEAVRGVADQAGNLADRTVELGREVGAICEYGEAMLPLLMLFLSETSHRMECFDGELIGATDGYDFYTLPAAIRRNEVSVIAFDLLHLIGKDWRRFRLRSAGRCSRNVSQATMSFQLSETFTDPHELLKAAEEHGLEDVLSTRKDLPYRSGR